MMAKPATTRGQPRSERKGRPPRPDPPLLRRPLPLPTPETRRRRSLRPRRPLQILKDEDYGFDREEEEDEEEEEEEGRGLKKLRLVVKLHRSPVSRETTRVGRTRRLAVVPPASSSSSSPSPASSSSSYVGDDEPEEEGDEEEQTVKPPKKRKIEVCTAVGGRSGKQEDRKENISYRSSGNSGTLAPSRSGTSMPERSELESILDKLQKKDTYGAFAEPVDPEELPDYHDVIEHPMDFGTIRKKLARVAYHSFEQFEDDVFLICSNAMQYNAPDTVYFRQASSIQDMAQKMFQKIRNNTKSTEADHRSEEKVRLSTMENKMPETQFTQQAQSKAILEPLTSDISSGATLASAGDTFTRLSTVNSIEKSVAINGLVDGSSSLGESKQEKGDEFSAKCSPSKLGRKSTPVDENRRATYSITPEQEPLAETDSILNLLRMTKSSWFL
ncbi:hypothetical protein HPP92_014180 [Vanilla planifolia]|uniref:Bromo domain-containing protein n=1 Tax=Vanilla planifolia TaxID=51239 RepID=A0A835UVG5_VANPL|nr:hypothetical protein HPP92_014180 [Vanilla planifolia]